MCRLTVSVFIAATSSSESSAPTTSPSSSGSFSSHCAHGRSPVKWPPTPIAAHFCSSAVTAAAVDFGCSPSELPVK